MGAKTRDFDSGTVRQRKSTNGQNSDLVIGFSEHNESVKMSTERTKQVENYYRNLDKSK